MTRYAILPVAMLTLTAGMCSTPQLQTQEKIVHVNVPTRLPCPDPADVPALPRRVADETPAMPTLADGRPDYEAISRILGAKIIELFTFGERAHGQLAECSRPGGP